jgi:hypothetical protein
MSARTKSSDSKYALAAFAVLIATPGYSSARADGPEALSPFDIRTHRYFSTYHKVVGSYLRAHSPRRKARACVVGLRGGGTERAWVIWRGGGRLVLWEENTEGLSYPIRDLSLSKDVVATQAQIGTSTYLVDRPWVNKIERQCAAFGYLVSVN